MFFALTILLNLYLHIALFHIVLCAILLFVFRIMFLQIRVFREISRYGPGADPGIFDWGGPNFGSERTTFLGGGGVDKLTSCSCTL